MDQARAAGLVLHFTNISLVKLASARRSKIYIGDINLVEFRCPIACLEPHDACSCTADRGARVQRWVRNVG